LPPLGGKQAGQQASHAVALLIIIACRPCCAERACVRPAEAASRCCRTSFCGRLWKVLGELEPGCAAVDIAEIANPCIDAGALLTCRGWVSGQESSLGVSSCRQAAPGIPRCHGTRAGTHSQKAAPPPLPLPEETALRPMPALATRAGGGLRAPPVTRRP
jgi:hypothetical protein